MANLLLELLKSYRIAHARVVAIEPFEKALRENTPLTSTIDADALVEYLSQISLKGEMVTDELKRVSRERDTFKQKLDEAEKSTREAWHTVAGLRAAKGSEITDDARTDQGTKGLSSESIVEAPTENEKLESPSTPKSYASPSKPHHPSIPGISIFSPKAKAKVDTKPEKEPEEFFSYDNEIPRLESELQAKQDEVDGLKAEVGALKRDLGVAHESTQDMVKTLENTARQLNELKDQKARFESDYATQQADSGARIKELESEVEQAKVQIQEASERKVQTEAKLISVNSDLEVVQQISQSLKATNEELQNEKASSQKRTDTLNGLVITLKEQIATEEVKVKRLQTQLNAKDIESKQLQERIIHLEKDRETGLVTTATLTTGRLQPSVASSEAAPKEETKILPDATVSSKKKSKKKRKGGKSSGNTDEGPILEGRQEVDINEETHGSGQQPAQNQSETVARLQAELNHLQSLIETKDKALIRLQLKLKDEEVLREEIETLKENLLDIGDEHVQAKDQVKKLTAEKTALAASTASLEEEIAKLRAEQVSEESKKAYENLASQFEDLTTKANNLQTDLNSAQGLASSRYQEMVDHKTALEKAQPELTSLREEVGTLQTAKLDLTKRVSDLQRIEGRHETVRSELVEMRKRATASELEVKSLTDTLSKEKSQMLQAEESHGHTKRDLQALEEAKRENQQTLDKMGKDLAKSQADFRYSQSRIVQLEGNIEKLNGDITNLRDEIELKTAQYVSAESLMNSMRDQSTELALQAKEARERCDNLEEEVADAHRLLSERSREGDTMRRLLADVEGRAESRLREMKERMDVAVEERDRAEDEASTQARRRSRELEELKNKLRDAERNLKRAEGDRDDLEVAQRDWKRRREELETRSEQSTREVQDVKDAMGQLRDALDENERQVRELEKQKAELRRLVEETQQRSDKLHKANKASVHFPTPFACSSSLLKGTNTMVRRR